MTVSLTSSISTPRITDMRYHEPLADKEFPHIYQIAVLEWEELDGIASVLANELARLNQSPIPFRYGEPVPDGIDVLLTFGPYGKILPIWQEAASRRPSPVVVHWNTEGMPDIKLPTSIIDLLAYSRAQIGLLSNSSSQVVQSLAKNRIVHWVDHSMHRLRYVGDYKYAYQKRWLHILADSSEIYRAIRTRAGVPTLYIPWGGTPDWYADMGLKRDIDVLWIGKRGSARRSDILDRVIRELKPLGVKMHIADNEENPFIFDEERTEYLNRAKITLNITRTWFDDNFSRFAMAAPNRSLIVSEPILPHCLEFMPGEHYISAPIPELSEAILYYLENEQERNAIVENAYQLTTQEMTFANSLKKILFAIADYRASHPATG
jgi:hypothetical protein